MSESSVTSRLRLRGYDYSAPGGYFVTICVANRSNLFGDVRNGALCLSTAGLMAESWWYSIAMQFPSVMIDEMVVMPNHIHGILFLGTDPDDREPHPCLSDIIAWYKSRTTHDYILGVRRYGWAPFERRLWQHRFYDHIIRSDASLERIREYIRSNPANWDEDSLNRPR